MIEWDDDMNIGLWLQKMEEKCKRVGDLAQRMEEEKESLLKRLELYRKKQLEAGKEEVSRGTAELAASESRVNLQEVARSTAEQAASEPSEHTPDGWIQEEVELAATEPSNEIIPEGWKEGDIRRWWNQAEGWALQGMHAKTKLKDYNLLGYV